ncbi:MAG: uroporphyrinogen-III synthase [Deltaproteobacteria bacterium]|nr:uroporphyrinogen-III synthase [Deltaproteobacteria bacterium]
MGILSNKLIIVTRALTQARELTSLLKSYGAIVVEIPVLDIKPVTKQELTIFKEAIKKAIAGYYDGILFTSSNAVKIFNDFIASQNINSQNITTQFFAVGQTTTKTLSQFGYSPIHTAAIANAENLLLTIQDAFGEHIAQQHLLWPRARNARLVLIEGLRLSGAQLDAIVAYETCLINSNSDLPADNPIDWITFASPSTVNAFTKKFGILSAKVACIGSITAAAAQKAGWVVSAIADEPSAHGLVKVIINNK